MVGVLRSTDTAELRPAPTAPDDIGKLVADARLAGVDATWRVWGSFPEGASDASVVAVHRTVQEALTNVARHGGAVAAHVQIDHRDTRVEVVVRNDSPTKSPPGDLQAAQHGDQNQADWEHRYRDTDVWSGNPNGALVDETRGVKPGTALDVGAGEGADSVWLAQQGWTVTAIDIAQNAIDRITERAAAHSLDIDAIRTDVNALHAIEPAAFDLVTVQYGAIPRTPDDRAIRSLVDAVVPGGTLLVVGHAGDPTIEDRGPDHPSRVFDANAYVSVEDFERFITDLPLWDITFRGERPRPAGSATDHAHRTDTIVHARRTIFRPTAATGPRRSASSSRSTERRPSYEPPATSTSIRSTAPYRWVADSRPPTHQTWWTPTWWPRGSARSCSPRTQTT